MLEKEQLHVGARSQFCTLADLSPQPCTLAASDLPNAESSVEVDLA